MIRELGKDLQRRNHTYPCDSLGVVGSNKVRHADQEISSESHLGVKISGEVVLSNFGRAEHVAVNTLPTKEKGVRVVRNHPLNKSRPLQKGALRLCLCRRRDVWYSKENQ